jgi:dTDP-glucose 4,6-dehydratase
MKVVVTGAAGFIGSNLVRLMVHAGTHQVVALDALTYAGHLSSLEGVLERIRFVRGDIRDGGAVRGALEGAEAVLHLAAESHVDRSIRDGRAFLETNVVGTQVLLDAARQVGVRVFVQVSTDEVYGSLGETGVFTEDSPVAPRSPYAASKAAADLLALAHHETYGLPVVVTRCSNNYGPYQFPEKLIPLAIVRALYGLPVPVYGDGRNVRDWIHVEDHCRGILAALERGRPGRVYNLGASGERSNIDTVRAILQCLQASESLIQFVADRPGHDFRYAIDSRRAREELGWSPTWDAGEGLAETVRWYRDHRSWWEPLLGSEYQQYVRDRYGSGGGDGHG